MKLLIFKIIIHTGFTYCFWTKKYY